MVPVVNNAIPPLIRDPALFPNDQVQELDSVLNDELRRDKDASKEVGGPKVIVRTMRSKILGPYVKIVDPWPRPAYQCCLENAKQLRRVRVDGGQEIRWQRSDLYREDIMACEAHRILTLLALDSDYEAQFLAKTMEYGLLGFGS
jgi:hypothetical protein